MYNQQFRKIKKLFAIILSDCNIFVRAILKRLIDQFTR